MKEIPFRSGLVSSAVRVGDTVRRTGGAWTPAVQALLEHLHAKGFEYSPRITGTDEKGREILTYLEGESVHRPWIKVLKTNAGLRQVARMVRQYHDAVADFVPPKDAVWRIGQAEMKPGQVIRHGDLGPWNTLWRGDKLTALLDWDLAEPADPIVDVAQMVWYFVPLRGERGWQEAGFAERPDFAKRLAVLCEAYGGVTPDEVLRAVLELQEQDLERTERLGGGGKYPWSLFWDRGGMQLLQDENHWLKLFMSGSI
ncbi:MAG TPA: aminoglycoside phosphotransferase family protein [Candidatus Saccharimonadia bacterium]|jgi:hypothetical protein|nr:aminoglycoside phosphotransferase family protein [Candidatus Saccharimonadia bacterium]